MQRTLMLAATAVAAFSLAACSKQDAANPGQTEPVNAAQDAVGAVVGQTSAATVGQFDTDAFVSNAAQSDMYEIEAGKLATTKAKSADVKAFGKMMVDHHTAMMTEMKPLVAAAGKTPPPALDERRKGFLDNLKAAGPADFDKVYLSQQVAAHEEALTLMKGYADNGADTGLKAGAAKAVPKIQEHHAKAKALADKAG